MSTIFHVNEHSVCRFILMMLRLVMYQSAQSAHLTSQTFNQIPADLRNDKTIPLAESTSVYMLWKAQNAKAHPHWIWSLEAIVASINHVFPVKLNLEMNLLFGWYLTCSIGWDYTLHNGFKTPLKALSSFFFLLRILQRWAWLSV